MASAAELRYTRVMDLIVSNSPAGPVMDWGAGPRRCAVGPGGIAYKGREGDGVTPIGLFPFRRLFWRADRLDRPKCMLEARALKPEDGWCDSPGDPNYNKLVAHPYPVSAEHLWLDSHVYDIIVVIGFNDDPVVQGAGSAVFLHLARETYTPTAGCVALAERDMRAALAQIGPNDKVRIIG
jgi:L,D-peptidoglycan transpeptidase YkuD (ErfK/YbiS/YcfS/YnhG family)